MEAVPTASPEAAFPSGWRVVAASVCGAGHLKTGQACQDAHAWRVLSGRLLVAAVADGAGSAEFGGVGAVLAAERAVTALAGELEGRAAPRREAEWGRLLEGVMEQARTALEEQAVIRNMPLRELATTLILLAATPEGAVAAQVGDGAAVLRDAGGGAHALTRPRSEEYLNQTLFLTSEEALGSVQVGSWRGGVRQAALFSDGLQMLALKMPDGEPHAPFFAPLFRFAEEEVDAKKAEAELAQFLRSPRITHRTDDDLTLLLATFRR